MEEKKFTDDFEQFHYGIPISDFLLKEYFDVEKHGKKLISKKIDPSLFWARKEKILGLILLVSSCSLLIICIWLGDFYINFVWHEIINLVFSIISALGSLLT